MTLPLPPAGLDPSLRCPRCGATELRIDTRHGLLCTGCEALYPADSQTGTVAFSTQPNSGGVKADIQAWWSDLYRQIYRDYDESVSAERLDRDLDDLVALFHQREHMAVVEMGAIDLESKRVLEIGSGAGAHSCLFKRRGADVTAIDLTPARALSTARKLALAYGPGPARAYQADAENLPFQDESFDIVYSNGVLHHSEDTVRCIAEVHRVLRPGGRAVIMLYARHSANYWLSIVPRALLSGEIFTRPEAEWVGRVTEGTPRFGTTRNPITRVYSARGMRDLFSAFRVERLRKCSFHFDHFAVPRLTQLRDRALRWAGCEPYVGGGMLVYGKPFYADTKLELALGRMIGWGWTIVARK